MKIAKNYRIDEQLVSDMGTIAKSQNRSATNLIETVMKEYCAKYIAATSGKEGRVKKKK
jgi:hypothetical protein